MVDDPKSGSDRPEPVENDLPPPFDPDEDLITYIEKGRLAPIDHQ